MSRNIIEDEEDLERYFVTAGLKTMLTHSEKNYLVTQATFSSILFLHMTCSFSLKI